MARRNPQVEALQRENEALRVLLKASHADPGDVPFTACDNSCVLARAVGMATNGGCRCNEVKLRRGAMWWRRKAMFLEATVRELKRWSSGVTDSELSEEETTG